MRQIPDAEWDAWKKVEAAAIQLVSNQDSTKAGQEKDSENLKDALAELQMLRHYDRIK